MPESGIYMIIHRDSMKCYVGSAVYIRRRWTIHRRYLRRGDHSNDRLQQAWLEYGEEAFSFIVLEIVDEVAALTRREQYWMDELLSDYNVDPKSSNHAARFRWKKSPEGHQREAERKERSARQSQASRLGWEKRRLREFEEEQARRSQANLRRRENRWQKQRESQELDSAAKSP